MKIEDQVCSLDLAKRLKELGVPQGSLFYWTAYENSPAGYLRESDVPSDLWRIRTPLQKYFGDHDYQVSAFTVAEMGEMLPWHYSLPHKLLIAGGEYPCALKDAYLWEVRCHGKNIDAITEADARCRMLIHLIETGVIDAKTLK